MNEPISVEILPTDNKLNIPEQSFGDVKTEEPKKKWFSLKKAEKKDKNTPTVHEIVL